MQNSQGNLLLHIPWPKELSVQQRCAAAILPQAPRCPLAVSSLQRGWPGGAAARWIHWLWADGKEEGEKSPRWKWLKVPQNAFLLREMWLPTSLLLNAAARVNFVMRKQTNGWLFGYKGCQSPGGAYRSSRITNHLQTSQISSPGQNGFYRKVNFRALLYPAEIPPQTATSPKDPEICQSKQSLVLAPRMPWCRLRVSLLRM